MSPQETFEMVRTAMRILLLAAAALFFIRVGITIERIRIVRRLEREGYLVRRDVRRW